jgi:hypothetical protein
MKKPMIMLGIALVSLSWGCGSSLALAGTQTDLYQPDAVRLAIDAGQSISPKIIPATYVAFAIKPHVNTYLDVVAGLRPH